MIRSLEWKALGCDEYYARRGGLYFYVRQVKGVESWLALIEKYGSSMSYFCETPEKAKAECCRWLEEEVADLQGYAIKYNCL